MKPIEKEFKDYIEEHELESVKSALQISRDIQNSPLKYEVPGEKGPVAIYTHTLQIPKFFTQTDKKNFEEIARTFTEIFNRAIEAAQNDQKVMDLFGFDPRLQQLIRIKPAYQAAIPILRVDIFYDENTGDFKVCEFNTDGTSAMYENDQLNVFMKDNNAWMALKPDVEYMELCESWVDAFLKDVKEATGNEHPSIVITDFLEKAYLPELYEFEKRFKDRGLSCEVVDIRDLRFDGEKLVNPKTGTKFDALYRRAVTSDVVDHFDEVSDVLEALKQNKIVMIGSFQTQIPHSKLISKALFAPELRKYFTPEQNAFIDAHVPEAFSLDEKAASKIVEDRKKWIIKPEDSYGAKGVFAGVDVSQKQWETLVKDFTNAGYMVEEYIPHFKSVNIDLINSREFKDFSNLTGLYVYNGDFAGVYSRLSDSGIVSTQYNERMVPTYFINEKGSDR